MKCKNELKSQRAASSKTTTLFFVYFWYRTFSSNISAAPLGSKSRTKPSGSNIKLFTAAPTDNMSVLTFRTTRVNSAVSHSACC